MNMENEVTPVSGGANEVDLGFSAWVELSELADKPNEDDTIHIGITVKDEDDTEVALSTVDPETLEMDEAFRDGRYYTARFNAQKLSPTQEEIDAGAGGLSIEVYVGKFESRYTPHMDEGVQEFVEAAIRGERKPNTTSEAIPLDRTEEVTALVCRLAKCNQRDISQDPELGQVTKQLESLARMIARHDKTSDLSAYAKLPTLLNKLCGPAAAEKAA
jgi:hypothetical protein